MVITNQENDQFSDELGRILLNDMTIQNSFLNNIVATAKKYGFRDIHFDFDIYALSTEKPIINFYEKQRPAFNVEGWFLSTALAPKTSATQQGKWYEAHDYQSTWTNC